MNSPGSGSSRRSNMRSTRFQHDHAAPIPGRAIGYVRRGETWRIANSLLDVVGDGGMYSTVDDMLRWATAFERPEFAPLLSRMQTPGTLADGRAIASGYGMGLSQSTYRGLPTVSHGGALAGYRTHLLRVTGREVDRRDVVQQCDGQCRRGSRQMVAELYAPAGMSAASPVAPGAPPQAPPRNPVPRELGQAVAGVFYSDELDATYRIVSGADGVTLEVGSNAPIVLSLTGPDRLSAPPGRELTPVRDGAGRITGLTLSAGRVREIAFTKR